MPRKQPFITVEELQRMIVAPDTISGTRRWAMGELARRENSGKAGGRPKKVDRVTQSEGFIDRSQVEDQVTDTHWEADGEAA